MDEVADHHLELRVVALDESESRGCAANAHPDVRLHPRGRDLALDLGEQRPDVDGPRRDRQGARLHAAHVERRLDQLQQLPRVLQHLAADLALPRRYRAELAVPEELVVADDRVQRRPQLVRHRADELRLEAVRGAQIGQEPAVLDRRHRLLRDARSAGGGPSPRTDPGRGCDPAVRYPMTSPRRWSGTAATRAQRTSASSRMADRARRGRRLDLRPARAVAGATISGKSR